MVAIGAGAPLQLPRGVRSVDARSWVPTNLGGSATMNAAFVSDDGNTVVGLDGGADDYLTKPFEPVVLQARIGAILERTRLRDQEHRHLATIAAQAAELAAWNHTLEERVRRQVDEMERLGRLRRRRQNLLPRRRSDRPRRAERTSERAGSRPRHSFPRRARRLRCGEPR